MTALQAQTPDKQSAILAAYKALPKDDKQVLREEMARTGIGGQRFQAGPPFADGAAGPAILGTAGAENRRVHVATGLP